MFIYGFWYWKNCGTLVLLYGKKNRKVKQLARNLKRLKLKKKKPFVVESSTSYNRTMQNVGLLYISYTFISFIKTFLFEPKVVNIQSETLFNYYLFTFKVFITILQRLRFLVNVIRYIQSNLYISEYNTRALRLST